MKENYVLNREQIHLKSNETKEIILHKMINLENITFQIETSLDGGTTKRVEFEVSNAQGIGIKKTIILDERIKKFQLHYSDENYLSEFLFITLLSPSDIIIVLSVIEY